MGYAVLLLNYFCSSQIFRLYVRLNQSWIKSSSLKPFVSTHLPASSRMHINYTFQPRPITLFSMQLSQSPWLLLCFGRAPQTQGNPLLPGLAPTAHVQAGAKHPAELFSQTRQLHFSEKCNNWVLRCALSCVPGSQWQCEGQPPRPQSTKRSSRLTVTGIRQAGSKQARSRSTGDSSSNARSTEVKAINSKSRAGRAYPTYQTYQSPIFPPIPYDNKVAWQ